MGNLKNKSEINLDVAKHLLKEGYPPCVCHPAYYSCLQLMKYQIKNVIGIDYKQQEEEIVSGKANSHGYAIRKIRDYIKLRDGIKAANWFDRSIKDLKETREKADYKTDIITHTIASDAIDEAERLIRTIKELK